MKKFIDVCHKSKTKYEVSGIHISCNFHVQYFGSSEESMCDIFKYIIIAYNRKENKSWSCNLVS
jgi:hypothetical protein